MHNGVAAFPEAGDALARFRAGGGTVIFITNAPYPAHAVQRFLDRLGARGDSYDAITSSGDVTRGIVETRTRRPRLPSRPAARPPDLRRPRGQLRASRDRGLRGLLGPVRRHHRDAGELPRDAGVDAPAFAVHGLRQSRRSGRARRHAGHCAGALADAYVALGGEALYCGKPHAPIYEAALNQAAAFRGSEMPPLAGVLAIGDSVRTDLAGAAAFGVDFLFVISGLHADQFGLCGAPDLTGVFAATDPAPKSVIRRLRW